MPPAELAKLVEARDRIPRAAFDEAIAKLGEPGFSADPYLAQEAVSDTDELEPVVDRILEANPGQVEAYRGGKEGLLGFFVGQVMKETQGKANPRVVSDLVREKLGQRVRTSRRDLELAADVQARALGLDERRHRLAGAPPRPPRADTSRATRTSPRSEIPTTSLRSSEKHSYARSIPSGNSLGRHAFAELLVRAGPDPSAS